MSQKRVKKVSLCMGLKSLEIFNCKHIFSVQIVFSTGQLCREQAKNKFSELLY